ncbi:hypothetical protein RYX56_25525, partial [Alkalihalophilus lindianensis]|nr:hypothetical protein [Alkalihalophilus lindianensis]
MIPLDFSVRVDLARRLTPTGPYQHAPSWRQGGHMKLVVAIIKPSRLEEVRQALNSLDVHG